MSWKAASLVAFAVLALFPHAAQAQSETYKFDGVADADPQPTDRTDWYTSVNWGEDGFDPINPLIPDLDTRVEIQTSALGVNAPEIRLGNAEAQQVRIGREGGAGLLTISGGSLTLKEVPGFGNRFRVGSHDPEDPALPLDQRLPGTLAMSGGTLTVPSLWVGSGSTGTVNLTGGSIAVRENLYMDWSFDADSVFNMSAGTVNVAGLVRMYRNSSVNLDGGDFLVAGAAEIGSSESMPANNVQTPDVQFSMSGGLFQSGGSLRVNGEIVLDGGIMRAGNFLDIFSTGHIEVNDDGKFQVRNSAKSVAAVTTLISNGFITTNNPMGSSALEVSVVNVAGIDYTQVAVADLGIPGDFDNDLDVDGADFLIWQRGFGSQYDAADLAAWKANFGGVSTGLGSASAVPEPTTLVSGLLAAAGLVIQLRRSRPLRYETAT